MSVNFNELPNISFFVILFTGNAVYKDHINGKIYLKQVHSSNFVFSWPYGTEHLQLIVHN